MLEKYPLDAGIGGSWYGHLQTMEEFVFGRRRFPTSIASDTCLAHAPQRLGKRGSRFHCHVHLVSPLDWYLQCLHGSLAVDIITFVDEDVEGFVHIVLLRVFQSSPNFTWRPAPHRPGAHNAWYERLCGRIKEEASYIACQIAQDATVYFIRCGAPMQDLVLTTPLP